VRAADLTGLLDALADGARSDTPITLSITAESLVVLAGSTDEPLYYNGIVALPADESASAA
jgi:hypothetical protein